jgi:hypothetical protein
MLLPYDDQLIRDLARSQPARFLAPVVHHSNISDRDHDTHTCYFAQAVSTATGYCGDCCMLFMPIFLTDFVCISLPNS